MDSSPILLPGILIFSHTGKVTVSQTYRALATILTLLTLPHHLYNSGVPSRCVSGVMYFNFFPERMKAASLSFHRTCSSPSLCTYILRYMCSCPLHVNCKQFKGQTHSFSLILFSSIKCIQVDISFLKAAVFVAGT